MSSEGVATLLFLRLGFGGTPQLMNPTGKPTELAVIVHRIRFSEE